MEQYVEQAKALVENMKCKGENIGLSEAYFVEKYAFYAEDFSAVRELASEFACRGYEKEYGTIDGEFIKDKYREIEDKNSRIVHFSRLTREAENMISRGFEMLGKMKEHLKREGLLMDYEQYLVEQEIQKRREEIRQDFAEKGKGGKANVRS